MGSRGFDVNQAFNASYFLAKHGWICLGFHPAHDLQGMAVQNDSHCLGAAGDDLCFHTSWFAAKGGLGRSVERGAPHVFINELVGGVSGEMADTNVAAEFHGACGGTTIHSLDAEDRFSGTRTENEVHRAITQACREFRDLDVQADDHGDEE